MAKVIDAAFNTSMEKMQKEAGEYIGMSQELDDAMERFINAACELRAWGLARTTSMDNFIVMKEFLEKEKMKAWQNLCRVWRDDEADEEARKTAEEEYMDAARELEMQEA